ncbi:MAG: hypothetical protein AMJ56_14450 [Anaerolineae bacterium SG8_19]|nr:MAG: hypothetical protein AMJ56_14450 [Anaerolineae bacterium SG8_19]
MKSPKLQTLIDRATRTAYENATDWMRSDPAIAAQLRDGLRTTIEAFETIEADDQTSEEVLLNRMLAAVERVLSYYQSLPGSRGNGNVLPSVSSSVKSSTFYIQNETNLTSNT